MQVPACHTGMKHAANHATHPRVRECGADTGERMLTTSHSRSRQAYRRSYYRCIHLTPCCGSCACGSTGDSTRPTTGGAAHRGRPADKRPHSINHHPMPPQNAAVALCSSRCVAAASLTVLAACEACPLTAGNPRGPDANAPISACCSSSSPRGDSAICALSPSLLQGALRSDKPRPSAIFRRTYAERKQEFRSKKQLFANQMVCS
jgi:hypothetical protein